MFFVPKDPNCWSNRSLLGQEKHPLQDQPHPRFLHYILFAIPPTVFQLPLYYFSVRKNQYDGVDEYLVTLKERGERELEESKEESHKQNKKA